jgi:hypothetical protein
VVIEAIRGHKKRSALEGRVGLAQKKSGDVRPEDLRALAEKSLGVAGRQPRRLYCQPVGESEENLGADAIAGQTVHADAILREPENDGVACHPRARSESQTDLASERSET